MEPLSPDYLEREMLDALELFQYSFQFKDSLFVIVLESATLLDSILTDLQVIHSSQIFLLVVAPHSEELTRAASKLNERGLPVRYVRQLPEKDISINRLKELQKQLTNHGVVILGADLRNHALTQAQALLEESLDVAEQLNAKKVFLAGSEPALLIDGKRQSHLSPQEVLSALEGGKSFNFPQPFLTYLATRLELIPRDLVLLDAEPGALFQEIFTHRGRGTLLSREYPNVVRSGEPRDVFVLSRLLKPHMESGIIRAVSEEELSADVEHFAVYTINDAIVAAAKLVDFGEAAELAKFCSLPRYQGRGRAKHLAKELIRRARAQHKRYVFALSVSEKMWEFFTELGFTETPRDSLPEEWQKTYDFSRPSKAFRLDL